MRLDRRFFNGYWFLLHLVAIELAILIATAVVMAIGSGRIGLSAEADWLRSVTMTAMLLTLALALALGLYSPPHHWFWISMVALALTVQVAGFLRYLWPRASLSSWLSGGGALHDMALPLLFALSLALPCLALGVIGLHLRRLSREPNEALYCGRYSALGVGLGVSYAGLALLAPFSTDAPDVTVAREISPFVTPAHIVPEWHTLPFYAMLRAIPSKEAGAAITLFGLAVWLLLPFLAGGPAQPFWRRRILRWAVPALLVVVAGLAQAGALPAEGGVLLASQLLTAAYFAIFLVAIPASRARQ